MSRKRRLNIELLKKVQRRIKTIPESYDQNYWVGGSNRAPCGTVACLAGETIICAAPSIEEGIRKLRRMDNKGIDIPNTAAKLLGLNGNYWYSNLENETKIFLGNGSGFPEPYCTEFKRARRKVDKAAVVVRYLNQIIKTGKVFPDGQQPPNQRQKGEDEG